MAVKDKIAKMLYVDKKQAELLKRVATEYRISESEIMRKSLETFLGLFRFFRGGNETMDQG